jgi:ribosome biogenesis SPOUT family RNA methylase Rps3
VLNRENVLVLDLDWEENLGSNNIKRISLFLLKFIAGDFFSHKN